MMPVSRENCAELIKRDNCRTKSITINCRKCPICIDRNFLSAIIQIVLVPGFLKRQRERDSFMNADNTPSEMASYIVRRTEDVKEAKERKQNKNKVKYIGCAIAAVIALAFVCSRYGIEKSASAFEMETGEAAASVSVTEPATKEPETVVSVAAENDAENTEAQSGQQMQPACDEADAAAQAGTADAAFTIPDGTSLLEYMAKQEVSAEYEESLTGLLWNYELIADIRGRQAKEQEEEELLREEEYKELLVTMGIDEDYVSQDPELPEYLTKTYNPLMDIELSEEEMLTLMRLVEAEAPSEDIYGKILVANVVLNRVNSEKMADTVTGVIFEKIGGSTQFSPTAISWYWNSIVITDSTREAVARCLSGEDYSEGALYFYAWQKNPTKHKTAEWMQDLECVFTHGGHRFFR